MNHPTTPCPEHLKPVFVKVLAAIKAMLAGEDPGEGIYLQSCENKYICFVLGDMANGGLISKNEYSEATNFVEDCLRTGISTNPSFAEWWEVEHGTSCNNANDGRVAWLEFLIT